MYHWDYRIVRSKDNIFSVREVYYNDDGNIEVWGENPESLESDILVALKTEVEYILKAFDKPVLDEETLKKEVVI